MADDNSHNLNREILLESLWHFQEQVFSSLEKGRSVIIQAPTGAGKTHAALAPYLYMLAHSDASRFPRRCIYSVPMRVLANQFHQKYSKRMKKYASNEGLRQPEPRVTIQTGEFPYDPQFEGDLVFTTIDQVLSSFLNIPYSLRSRYNNLNAGAIASSYLIFDEFHLFDPDSTLPTTLEMLRLLKDYVPFALMTATFSRKMLDELKTYLDADVICLDDDNPDMFSDVPSQQSSRERIFHWRDEPLTAGHVIQTAAARQICICNLVDRANTLFDQLCKMPAVKNGEVEALLLTSRFTPLHRQAQEKHIHEIFHPAQDEYNGKPAILVATQVIEVGLDITCDVMHTEIAPAASLVQRAGRCARRKDESGSVYIYHPAPSSEDTSDGQKDFRYAPYFIPNNKPPMPRGEQVIAYTRQALESGHYTDKPLTYADEQAFVNAAHETVDTDLIASLKNQNTQTLNETLNEMFKAMFYQDAAEYNRLVRATEPTVHVIIHPDPESDDKLLQSPYAYEGVSLRPGTLAFAWQTTRENNGGIIDPEIVPVVAYKAESLDGLMEYEDPDAPKYRWRKLEKPEDIYTARVIALHPHFACDDPKRGLRPGEIGVRDAPPLREPERLQTRSYNPYVLETYAQHIRGLATAYLQPHRVQMNVHQDDDIKFHSVWRHALRDEIAHTLRRLDRGNIVSAKRVDRMIRLVLALHDIAKMRVSWQRFAHEWQKAINEPQPEKTMLAHTTGFEWNNEEQKALHNRIAKQFPRGNHAGEGAVLSTHLLYQMAGASTDEIDDALYRAAMTAIARHHTSDVKTADAVRLADGWQAALRDAFDITGLADSWRHAQEHIHPEADLSLQGSLVRFYPDTPHETLFYFLMVRVLRLADGRSFEVR